VILDSRYGKESLVGSPGLGYTDEMPRDQIVHLAFVDLHGHREVRRVVPDRIWFGKTDWVKDPQWLLDAYDVDRCTLRTYPMQAIEDFSADTVQGVPDRSTAAGSAR
jgi:hypothetical protein